MDKQKPPKKQHTVSDFYLRRFADSNSFVWVYDREKKELRSQPTKDTTIEKDFYTFNSRSGDKDYSIEIDLFANNLEPRANKVISNLEKGVLPDKEGRRDLSEFVAFQYLRTTASRQDLSYSYAEFTKLRLRSFFLNKERAKQTIENIEKDTGQKFGVTVDEAMEFANSDRFIVEAPKEYHLWFMLSSFKEFYSIYFQLNWTFFRAPKNSLFITSDNPLAIMRFNTHPFYGQHLGLAESTLPLTPEISLFMSQKGTVTTWKTANDKLANNLNIRTAIYSDRYLISRKRKQLDKLVKKTNIGQKPRVPRIKIEAPF